MQDRSTGEMIPIDPKFREIIKSLPTLAEQMDAMQQAKNEAIPEVKHQGPVFMEGEVITVRGGKFKISAIYKNGMTLIGLPADDV